MSRSSHPSNRDPSKVAVGIALVLFSAIGLATQNIVSRVFFVAGPLFSQVELGGWIAPQLNNIVMLLAIRMTTMAVLLAAVSPLLYARTFSAIQQLSQNLKLSGAVIGSGLCLFVGLTSLYFSLSQISAGVAIATFFIYPAITVLLAWRFLSQRPHSYQLMLMLVIFSGVALTTLSSGSDLALNPGTSPTPGILCALLAGLSFGLYGIFSEIALQSQAPLHPVPFSLLTFMIVSLASSLSLTVMPSINVDPASWQPIWVTTLLSALVTVVAYVLNNFGVRYIGASLTALISGSTPALTALLAWIALQESLQPQQMVGVGIVTVGVAALSLKAKQNQ
ncbi:MAG: EamA/RhaT family transporter [Leptolyngbya foveolarum]|uniref:EamA/RhaT family transporter n=1 Tax=Leptolyngbya foveolarum TaxID=47253 RepID=A0A2W4W1V9_9CYAN|nr:MAG: EamA/RhaT family transporter [Leptolyngbya foveolarum]